MLCHSNEPQDFDIDLLKTTHGSVRTCQTNAMRHQMRLSSLQSKNVAKYGISVSLLGNDNIALSSKEVYILLGNDNITLCK